MTDRGDPVLSLLPEDDDLPRAFRGLGPDEQAWRGRLFLLWWLIFRHQGYAWSIALSSEVPDDARQAVSEMSDEQILADLAVCPLPK